MPPPRQITRGNPAGRSVAPNGCATSSSAAAADVRSSGSVPRAWTRAAVTGRIRDGSLVVTLTAHRRTIPPRVQRSLTAGPPQPAGGRPATAPQPPGPQPQDAARTTASAGCGLDIPSFQYRDDDFTRLWATCGPGWTGGDGAYSVALPDGRSVWLFGDSFMG